MQRFIQFNGANRALHPLNLPVGVGVNSLNQRPGRGDLRPWRNPLAVATVPSGRSTIYRMGRDAPSDTSYWLSWAADVDVVRGLTADDPTERTFWSGDGAPKWTDNTIGLTAPPYPNVVRTLGVPAPTAAPTVSVTPGTGTVETRYYVWTWVTSRGEESAPSPVSAQVNATVDSTFAVSFDDSIPSGRDIDRKRLYRTVTGTSGATDFYFVAEVAVSTGSFTDAGTDPVEPLPSATWLEPPAGLRGLKALWNGTMAGFTGKSIRFCEPYRPFAWPIEYELVVDDAIVGLGAWGQNLIVLTTGRPHLITGTDPASMSQQPLEFRQSCVSKRSIVDLGHGVAWASPDGLCYIGSEGPRVATSGVMLREDWQALGPASITAVEFEGAYFASYGTGTKAGFMLDAANPQGVFFMSSGFDAAFRDSVTDGLYLLNGSSVQKWDAGAGYMTAEHDSRTEIQAAPVNYGWARVRADAYPVSVTFVAEGTGSAGRFTKTYGKSVTSGQPFRLPSGWLADEWRVEISTANPVQAVLIGNDVAELLGG